MFEAVALTCFNPMVLRTVSFVKKMLFLILVIDSMIINNGNASEFVPEDIINDAVNIASGNSVVPSDSKLLLDPK